MPSDAVPPRDKGGFVYICFFLYGAAIWAPWNAFITAVDYFNKLYPGGEMDRKFSVVDLPVTTITLLILMIWSNQKTARLRIIIGLSAYVVITALVPMLNSTVNSRGEGSSLSQGLTLGAAGLSGIFDALAEPAIVAEAGYLPEVYMQGYALGTAASGTMICLLRIATKLSFGEDESGLEKSTVLYFNLASILCAICLVLYLFVLPNHPFYKYYHCNDKSQEMEIRPLIVEDKGGFHDIEKDLRVTSDNDGGRPKSLIDCNVVAVTLKLWPLAVSVYLVFTTTLTVFPGAAADVQWENWGDWYSIGLITLFNIGDFSGNALPLVAPIIRSEIHVLFWSAVRMLFLPAFFMAIEMGTNPVLMIPLMLAFGLSNGYFHANIYMLMPDFVMPSELGLGGNIIVFYELSGLVSGAIFGWLWLWLL